MEKKRILSECMKTFDCDIQRDSDTLFASHTNTVCEGFQHPLSGLMSHLIPAIERDMQKLIGKKKYYWILTE